MKIQCVESLRGVFENHDFPFFLLETSGTLFNFRVSIFVGFCMDYYRGGQTESFVFLDHKKNRVAGTLKTSRTECAGRGEDSGGV